MLKVKSCRRLNPVLLVEKGFGFTTEGLKIWENEPKSEHIYTETDLVKTFGSEGIIHTAVYTRQIICVYYYIMCRIWINNMSQ